MINSKRYSRQMLLPEIGEEGQYKLQQAKVLVIGAGGLGCPVLQNLAAAGVGHIGIVDGDVVDESNLHRQLLYNLDDCGKNKAATAKAVLRELNPELELEAFDTFLNIENAVKISQGYHILVDCTDSIELRYLISDLSVAKRIPMVYASIHKFEGQLSVFNYKNGPSYRCLFPEEEGLNKVPNCAQAGVLGVLPNTMGVLQATEVLKILLEIGTVLSGKLLIYDALRFSTQIIEFVKNPKMIEKSFVKGSLILRSQKSEADLLAESFLQKYRQGEALFIDLREETEIGGAQKISGLRVPLKQLGAYSSRLDKNREIVLFCQFGQRSRKALEYLKKEGFIRVFHLEQGINSCKNVFDAANELVWKEKQS